MYDAIVVGARCAGSPTAMLLARKGYRVLLVDRAAFPSDCLSTHYIHQPGVARLKRWGLLEKVRASNCPPVTRMRFDVGPFALSGSPPPSGDTAEAFCPRRSVLDKILVDAAVKAGAEVRERFLVEELLFEGERVIGLRGHIKSGSSVVERARLVIGADGVHSLVARAAGAPVYDSRAKVSCIFFSYWSGVAVEGTELYPRDGYAIIAVPTNNAQTLIVTLWRQNRFAEFRADVEANYLRTMELAPGLAERVRQGRREERISGTADLPNFYRKPYGPGWALVGDAGFHKDPCLAQGITDAFRDAELLTDAIDDGFSGGRPLEAALADYERRRNEASKPLYELNWELARLEPAPPEHAALHSALRENPAETDRFLGVIAGTVPVGEFYAPENIARITGRMARLAAG